jgi:hypothetical protein
MLRTFPGIKRMKNKEHMRLHALIAVALDLNRLHAKAVTLEPARLQTPEKPTDYDPVDNSR